MSLNSARIQLRNINKNDNIFFSNPDIAFFKNVYRRHSKFSRFCHSLSTFSSDFLTTGNNITMEILKNGDLLSNLYLEFEVTLTVPNNVNVKQYNTVNHFATSLVHEAKFLVNDKVVDSYKNYMKQMNKELRVKSNKSYVEPDPTYFGLPTQVHATGNDDFPRTEYTEQDKYENDMPLIFRNSDRTKNINPGTYVKKFRYYFDFYFCKEFGASFPMISTCAVPVSVKIDLENIDNLLGPPGEATKIPQGALQVTNCKLFGEFIILDQDEKNFFRNSKLEYLYIRHNIQNQIKQAIDTTQGQKVLNFDGFVRDIIWAVRPTQPSLQGPCYFKSMTGESLYGSSKTIPFQFFLGNSMLAKDNSDIKYFTRYIPGRFFNNIPPLDRIGVYTFSLDPNDIQPSGLLDFSLFSQNFHYQFITNGADSNTTNSNISATDEIVFFTMGYNLLVATGNNMASPLFI